MPICQPRGCGCSYTSETLSIFPDESNINLIHFEIAEPSILTELQDDVAGLEAAVAALGSGSSASYTPTLTASVSNPNLGTTGSATGVYAQVGKLVYAQFVFTFGGTGIAQGSGTYSISLPVASVSHANSSAINRGAVTVWDSGTGVREFATTLGSTTLTLRPFNSGSYGASTAITDATIGLTFAALDGIRGGLTYIAA